MTNFPEVNVLVISADRTELHNNWSYLVPCLTKAQSQGANCSIFLGSASRSRKGSPRPKKAHIALFSENKFPTFKDNDWKTADIIETFNENNVYILCGASAVSYFSDLLSQSELWNKLKHSMGNILSYIGKQLPFSMDAVFVEPHTRTPLATLPLLVDLMSYGFLIPPYGLFFRDRFFKENPQEPDEEQIYQLEQLGKKIVDLPFYLKTHPAIEAQLFLN